MKWEWCNICGEIFLVLREKADSQRKEKAPKVARPNHSLREEGRGRAKGVLRNVFTPLEKLPSGAA